MRPCSSTTISSARRTVESRWAMISDVRPREQAVERALDQHLRRPVDVRGRLVENQDARVGEQRARDRDELALARGEAGAALAHDVLKPVSRTARRRGRGRRRRRRPSDLGVGRPGSREAQVRGDRPREQGRVLEDDAELPPVRVQVDLAQVAAVDADRARSRVVEARDQLRRRRLAAAGLADEREAASLRARGRSMSRRTGVLAVGG